MKHLFAVFVMVSLFICTSVFPTAAQDNPDAPVPCDADQVKQVLDLALPFGDQMNTVSLGNYPQTLDGDISKMLDWGDCSDPKRLDTKVPMLILTSVLAAGPTNLPQIRQG